MPPSSVPPNKRPYPMPSEGHQPPQKKQKITESYLELIMNGLNSNWGEGIPQISPVQTSLEKRFSTIVEYLQKCFQQDSLPVGTLEVAGKCFIYYRRLNIETKIIYKVAYQKLTELPVSFISFKDKSLLPLAKNEYNKYAKISQLFKRHKNKAELSINISSDEFHSLIGFLNSKEKQKEFFQTFNSFHVSSKSLKFLGILLECEIKTYSSKAFKLLISKIINHFYNHPYLDLSSDFELHTEKTHNKLAEINAQVLSKAKQTENELHLAEVKAILAASKTQIFDFETNKSILSKLLKEFMSQVQGLPSSFLRGKKLLMQFLIEALLSDLWKNSTCHPEINEQVNDLQELCRPLNLKYFKLKENDCFTLSFEQMEKVKGKSQSKELTISQYKENQELYKQIVEIPSLTADQFGSFISLLINPLKEEKFFSEFEKEPYDCFLQTFNELLDCAKFFECEYFINKIENAKSKITQPP